MAKEVTNVSKNLARSNALLSGLFIGGLVGSAVLKKSGKKKAEDNREIRAANYRRKNMKKKAEYVMEKIAWGGLGRLILGTGASAVGKAGKAINKAVPGIGKGLEAAAKTKPGKFIVDKSQKAGKNIKTWVDEPGSLMDPKSKNYIKDGKILSAPIRRQLYGRSGQILGFPARHPVTSLGVVYGKSAYDDYISNKQRMKYLHAGRNVSPVMMTPKNKLWHENRLVVPDSAKTNWELKTNQGYKGRPITQKEIQKEWNRMNSNHALIRDGLYSKDYLKGTAPSWVPFDDWLGLVKNKHAYKNGPKTFGEFNIELQDKYKNVPTDPKWINEAYTNKKFTD